MKNLPTLRLLLAALMLYFAWPKFTLAASGLEMTFWGMWLAFLLLVVGANLANLLQMIAPPVMEQSFEENKIRANR
ncbi:hypothetical protein M3210_12895 [Oceanobacillus luteolus]|uniref:Uncharacterized protein n=1 Tax=Oceanobacillus luteolus TaxID=1274358 RepID=A0ABW4HPN1_9BACI|nr:hypothetical protein [Oceanobacillus luteolus]MCM3741168.1 hypothetical protein [Oceanobacillus luteolus]